MNVILKLLIFVLAFALTSCIELDIDLPDYEKMPPVHLHDDYLDCLKDYGDAAVYCTGKTYVKPDLNSTVWSIIQRYSADHRKHFRHEKLDRSFCANRCREVLSNRDAAYVPHFEGDARIHFTKLKYTQSVEDQKKYGELINKCGNLEMEQYGLQAYTELDYCTTKESETFSMDWVDGLFLLLCAGILALTFWGTLYDFYLKPGKTDQHKFASYVPKDISDILLAFAVQRNWSNLITINNRKPNPNNTLADDFAFFEAIRILVMVFNTIVHIWSTLCSLPSSDPEQFEKWAYTTVFKIVCGATFTNQIFLTFAGFLLTKSAVKDLNKGKVFTFKDFYDDLKKRYWRLTPLYAFAIFLEATWVRHAYDGTFWQNYWSEDYGNCRQNWWANLLYVHNLVDPRYQCILPTWYLSTDMQLYIVRFIILYVISHLPRFKVHILGFLVTVSYIIPGVVAYVYDIDSVYSGTIEGTRVFYRQDVQYTTFHIPPHTNFGSYLGGMITAFIYFEIQQRKINIRESRLFMYLWHSVYPGLAILFSCSYFFNTFQFSRPAIWIAVGAAIHKNLWGILIGTTIIGYNAGMGGFWKTFMSSDLWKVFGKTNYGFYLTHMTMLKFLVGNFHHPYYFSFANCGVLLLSVTILSYYTGTIVHVLIELPAANLQKVWDKKFNPPKKPSTMNHELNNNNNHNSTAHLEETVVEKLNK